MPVQVPQGAREHGSGRGALQGELRPHVGQGDAADGRLARGPAAVGHQAPQAHPKVRVQGKRTCGPSGSTLEMCLLDDFLLLVLHNSSISSIKSYWTTLYIDDNSTRFPIRSWIKIFRISFGELRVTDGGGENSRRSAIFKTKHDGICPTIGWESWYISCSIEV